VFDAYAQRAVGASAESQFERKKPVEAPAAERNNDGEENLKNGPFATAGRR
jgi:hypothetical protein